MRLSLLNLLLLVLYALFMAAGQIAFKYVAIDMERGAPLFATALKLPLNPWFWVTGVFYGFSMVYWIWLLGRIPVSVAYPFASLSLVILAILSWFIYGEPLTLRYFAGLALMISGLALIVG